MDSSDIFDTASQEGEEEYEEELSAAEVVLRSNYLLSNLSLRSVSTRLVSYPWKMEYCLNCMSKDILKVLAKLEEAWINERNSPELLHPRMEMVGSIGHCQDGR